MPDPEAVPNTVGHVCGDLGEIAAWIEGVRKVLDMLPSDAKAIRIPAGRWEPPPTATPAPIASPKCIRPAKGTQPTTSVLDLTATPESLNKWTTDLASVFVKP